MAQHAINNLSNRTVQVNREKLLSTLQENKTKHESDYKEALGMYAELAKQNVQESYEKAKADLEKNYYKNLNLIEEFKPDDIDYSKYSGHFLLLHGTAVNLPLPKNYSNQYQDAINMVSWDVNETLVLTHSEFKCFVMDEWDWSYEFKNTVLNYSGCLNKTIGSIG